MRNFISDSIHDLVADIKDNLTTFIREEIELVKKEMSEKASTYVRNGVKLAVGGFIAYAGLIVFLAGIGLIIGFGFERLGLDPVLAVFIGLAIVGLLAGAIGAFMVLHGIKVISATPPMPEKTIDTFRQIGSGADGRGFETPKTKPSRTEDPRSAAELHKSVIGTAEELASKLSPRDLRKRAVRHMKEHPMAWGVTALGGAATLATGAALLGRKSLGRRALKWLGAK
ncbi:MAG TPA: phage holin family protein [Verrucomicrobiae bacterium]|jgi:hypothetical protein|nr:phage holin family protein [Verrucomicrobiae bacterium]